MQRNQNPTTRTRADQHRVAQLGSYLPKAAILVIALVLVARLVPVLPACALSVIIVLYAISSVLGALHFVVIRRTYRQNKLTANGRIASLNRKWTGQLIFLYALSAISAFSFLLGSPTWDVLEWVLIALAAVLYFVVFQVFFKLSKEEFAPRYDKATALQWTFWCVGVAGGLIYAICTTLFANVDYASLSEAFDSVPMAYMNSPSELMAQAEQLSSFFTGFGAYAISETSHAYAIVGFIWRFVIFASVFFGLVNQFALCLLDKQELADEFHLLPSSQQDKAPQPIVKRYAAVLVILSIIIVGSFMIAEVKTEELQSQDGYTALEASVNQWKEDLIYQTDGELTKDRHRREVIEAFKQKAAQLLSERNAELVPLVNGYYDRCLDQVDLYLDWHDGWAGSFFRLVKPFGDWSTNQAKDAFKKTIAENADNAEVQTLYQGYRDRLDSIVNASLDELTDDPMGEDFIKRLASEAGANDAEIDLWPFLSKTKGNTEIDSLLQGLGDGEDREAFKERLSELIEQTRADTVASLDAQQERMANTSI